MAANAQDVRFQGTVLDRSPDGIDYLVRIEQILEGDLQGLGQVLVDVWDQSLIIGSIEVGDRVEVYGHFYGGGVSVQGYPHYIKEIGPSGPPDLTLQQVGFDRSEPLRDGDTVYFGTVIVNQGDGDASNFEVQVYLDDWLYDSGRVSLGAHQSDTLWASNPWTATEGTHTLTWIADSRNEVAESNEANNRMSRTFTVGPPPFVCKVSVTPSSLTVVQGDATVFQVAVEHMKGPSRMTTLSLSGLPSGATHSFDPSSGTPTFSSTLTVSTSLSTPAKTYSLSITAKADTGETCKATLTLVVNEQPFEFSVSASPSSQSVLQGEKTQYEVTITRRSGATRKVNLSVTGLPTGAKASFDPPSCNPDCKSTLAITTSKDTPPGSYTLTITGKDGGKTYSTSVTLNIQAPVSLEVLVFPEELGLTISGSGEYALGATVALEAPVQVGDMYFLGWWLDGVPKTMSKQFAPEMDVSHRVAAVYVKSSAYQSILTSVKKQVADRVEDVAKTIVEKAKQLSPNEDTIDIAIDLDLTAMGVIETYKNWALFAKDSKYFSGTPSFVLAYAFDVGQLAIDVSKCVAQEDECDIKKIEDDLLELAKTNLIVLGDLLIGNVVCGAILGAATIPVGGLGALACPVISTAILYAVQQVKWDGKPILEHFKDGVDRFTSWLADELRPHVCDFIAWILPWAVCASAGSDVRLLFVDPEGHRVGGTLQNNEWTAYRDIRGSWYSGLDSHPQYVAIPNPRAGTYRFTVTAKEAGSFQLMAASIVDGSTVATQQYSGTIGQGETQELSAELTTGGSIQSLKATPWGDRYQPWLVYGALAIVAVSVIAVYATRTRRRERRSTQVGPRVKGIGSAVDKPRVKSVQETGTGPRVLRVEEE